MTWPDYMRRETVADRLDMKPAYFDQLVRRGVLPQPRKVGEQMLWSWAEVDAAIKGGKTAEPTTDDPYLAGARRAAEAPAPRQARPQQGRQAIPVPDAAPRHGPRGEADPAA